MADPFIGEIRMFGGNFAPVGWAFCNGQLQAIAQNEALFNLIGTTYGGDGVSTFSLPDLRSRVPVHQGSGPGLGNRTIGEFGGTEQVTLTTPQLPAHSHALNASPVLATPAASRSAVLASSAGSQFYGSGNPTTVMAASAITAQGGSQPHNNIAPVLVVSFIISLFGIFPSQN